jgi:hypothetical protein
MSFRAAAGASMNASYESSGAERRVHARHTAKFVINIETATRKDRFGIARNASAGGLLFNTPSRFWRDEAVLLSILFPTRAPIRITARMVRVETAAEGMPFHYMAAVRFDEPQAVLADVLCGLAWD